MLSVNFYKTRIFIPTAPVTRSKKVQRICVLHHLYTMQWSENLRQKLCVNILFNFNSTTIYWCNFKRCRFAWNCHCIVSGADQLLVNNDQIFKLRHFCWIWYVLLGSTELTNPRHTLNTFASSSRSRYLKRCCCPWEQFNCGSLDW